jgi:hypothetical protein
VNIFAIGEVKDIIYFRTLKTCVFCLHVSSNLDKIRYRVFSQNFVDLSFIEIDMVKSIILQLGNK